MSPIDKNEFLKTFTKAVEGLMAETAHLGWTTEELALPARIRNGEKVKLNGRCRIFQDNFIFTYGNFFRDKGGNAIEYLALMDELKLLLFTDWVDWKAVIEGRAPTPA